MYDYEKEGYFVQEYALGTIDVSCFMEKFQQVWQELEKVSFKYIGKISRLGVVAETGELTDYINVYRTADGKVHGSPANSPK